MSRLVRFSKVPKFFGVALLASLVFLTSGCASIPLGGQVQSGDMLATSQGGFTTFDYIPAGPTMDATPEQILRGFILAALSPQDDYSTARSFLTPDFAKGWQPESSITVDGGTARSYLALDDNTWQLTVVPEAFVDEQGDYREADSTRPVTQPYKFETVDGQWRISEAPDGIIIDSISFANVFSPRTLYFFDATNSYLVPDQRWFAAGTTTPARVVRALLAGPSSWLASSVVSAFPEGSELGFDSVALEQGVAFVDLAGTAGSAGENQLALMRVQLQHSLGSGVRSVTLFVDGVEKTPSVTVPTPIINPPVDTRPIVFSGEKFGYLSGDEVVDIAALGGQLKTLSPDFVMVAADNSFAVVRSAGAIYRVDATGARLLDGRPMLIEPALDPQGFVWSVPKNDPSALLVTDPLGATTKVTTNWPEASRIDSISVSRDGSRLSAVIETQGGTRALALGVVRNDVRAPIELGAGLPIAFFQSANVLSQDWLDQLNVVFLFESREGQRFVRVQEIGGSSRTISAPDGASNLAAGAGTPGYWVLKDDGTLESVRGSGWQSRAEGVGLLAIQRGTPQL